MICIPRSQNAPEHDLGIDQILGAAETDHADFRPDAIDLSRFVTSVSSSVTRFPFLRICTESRSSACTSKRWPSNRQRPIAGPDPLFGTLVVVRLCRRPLGRRFFSAGRTSRCFVMFAGALGLGDNPTRARSSGCTGSARRTSGSVAVADGVAAGVELATIGNGVGAGVVAATGAFNGVALARPAARVARRLSAAVARCRR